MQVGVERVVELPILFDIKAVRIEVCPANKLSSLKGGKTVLQLKTGCSICARAVSIVIGV